jgi:hypothetical protein
VYALKIDHLTNSTVPRTANIKHIYSLNSIWLQNDWFVNGKKLEEDWVVDTFEFLLGNRGCGDIALAGIGPHFELVLFQPSKPHGHSRNIVSEEYVRAGEVTG